MLKKSHNAKEVVFKIETKFDSKNNLVDQTNEGALNLRDPAVHCELLRSYYVNQNLEKEDWTKIEDMTKKYIDAISRTEEETRNTRWTINSMKFSNTFSYGSNNYINFDNLPGITGIFGRNARGKSSIIGTLVYGLFNASDRGSVKNIHIINTRHSTCDTSIDVSVSGINYRIVRDTAKKQTKKNIWAPTNLKFYKLNNSGDVIEDLTEEQRRETEKILRQKIGTSEEFLMTSLASQGEINSFIKEKAAARKNILSNFLDLEIFDKINEMAKKDSGKLRAQISVLSSENWEKKYDECLSKIDDHLLTKVSCENKINEFKNNVKQLRNSINSDTKYISQTELNKKLHIVEKTQCDIVNLENKKEILIDSISDQTDKIKKIEQFLVNFDLVKIKKKRDSKRKIKQTLLELKGSLRFERKELDNISKSVKILDQVPCGDTFPTCKFIKNSHKNKLRLEKQEEKVTFISVKVDDIQEALAGLTEDFEGQIEKFNQVLNRKSKMVDEISDQKIDIERLTQHNKSLKREFTMAKSEYENILAQFNSQNTSSFKEIHDRIETLEKELKSISSQRDMALSHIASWRAKRDLYKKEYQFSYFIHYCLRLMLKFP